MKRSALLLSLLLTALPLCLTAKDVKIHGYITELKSPTEFQIDEYRINRDATLELEIEKDENDPKSPITFTPSDLRVGSEIEIRGELDDTGAIKAKIVKVILTDHKTVSRTALLAVKPFLQKSDQSWEGSIRVDGQTLLVKPTTKVTFVPNAVEKKAIKSAKKAAAQQVKKAPEAEADADDEEVGDPLQSLESVVPDSWATYKGTRQPDGTILASSVQFKHNELESGEARMMKDLTPHVKALKNSAADLTIQKVGKYHLYPDDQVQTYVRQLGAKLVPEYQRSLLAGSPDKINFQFFVVDQKVTNAFALSNGTVVIYSRMFELLENEAQFAAVLGHEMSHAIQEHTYRQMQYHKKALLALKIGGAIAAARGNYSIANAATLIEAAVRNGYSRSLEDQADRLGLEYMINAGYDPREAPRVWKVLTLAEGDKPTNFFWSNHSNNTTRRSYLMAELKNNYTDLDYSKLQKGDETFNAVAGRVKARTQSSKKVRVKY